MPFGMRIKNSSGEISSNYTDNLARIVREVVTGTSNGSVSVPEWGGSARGFFVVIESPPTNIAQPIYQGPEIFKSGTTLSWSWPSTFPWPKVSSRVIIGIY